MDRPQESRRVVFIPAGNHYDTVIAVVVVDGDDDGVYSGDISNGDADACMVVDDNGCNHAAT